MEKPSKDEIALIFMYRALLPAAQKQLTKYAFTIWSNDDNWTLSALHDAKRYLEDKK